MVFCAIELGPSKVAALGGALFELRSLSQSNDHALQDVGVTSSPGAAPDDESLEFSASAVQRDRPGSPNVPPMGRLLPSQHPDELPVYSTTST